MNHLSLYENECSLLLKVIRKELDDLRSSLEPEQNYRFYKFTRFEEVCESKIRRAQHLYSNEIAIIKLFRDIDSVNGKLQFWATCQKPMNELTGKLKLIEKDIQSFKKNYRL